MPVDILTGAGEWWAVCFECDERLNITKRGGNRDRHSDFQFPEPASKIAGMSPEKQKATLRHFRDRDASFKRSYLTAFGNSVFRGKTGDFIQPRFDSGEISDLFKEVEEKIGVMTNILRDDQSLTFDVDLGHVSLIKTDLNNNDNNIFEGLDDSVTLPNQKNLRNSDGKIVAAIFVHKNLTFLDFAEKPASKVVSVSVFESDGKRMRNGVDLVRDVLVDVVPLENVTAVEDAGYLTCAYWDMKTNSWAVDGCSMTPGFQCRCSHLTNFALILNIDLGDADWNDALRKVTLTCCSLSAFGLFLTLVFYGHHRGNDLTDRIKINANFCLNLLVVQLAMIFGVDRAENEVVCAASSVLLHLALLTSFSWSMLSGHQIYVLLVKVFEGENEHQMRNYYLLGYLAPVLIIVISLISDYFGLDLETYTRFRAEGVCWLWPTVVFYAFFLTPLTLVLVFNVSMLALALYKVARVKPRPHMFGQARGWLGLALLLGLTWIFGLAAKLTSSFELSVLFVVVNSLQGILIFIFTVLLGQRFRTRFRREIDSRFQSFDLTGSSVKKQRTTSTSA